MPQDPRNRQDGSQKHPKGKCPWDIKLLAIFVGVLWGVTIAWQVFGLDYRLDPPNHSEAAVWVLTFTGVIFLYFIVLEIVAAWGIILGIPTSFLVINFALRKAAPKRRWFISGAGSTVLFVGVPLLLNHGEERRFVGLYQRNDVVSPPQIEGRAVELQNSAPSSTESRLWHECSDRCLELLVRGHAQTVTMSFPGAEDAPAGGPFYQTFRLGSVGPDCAGEIRRYQCARLDSSELPADRIIVWVGSVNLPADSVRSTARRLYVRDTRDLDASPRHMTSFTFAHFPGLLNIAWGAGRFYLPRRGLPMFTKNGLDDELYGKLMSKKVLRGSYSRFHS